MELGGKIRELRLDRGLGLTEAAELAGLTKAGLWKIETGRVAEPKLSTRQALAVVLRCPLAELLPVETAR